MFQKFLRIRRRKTRTTATEGTAEPDCGLTELQSEPDVCTDSAEPSKDSDTALNDHRAEADMAVAGYVVITIANTGETQGIRDTGTAATPTVIPAPTMDFFQKSGISSVQEVPAIVRNIHQRLESRLTVDARMQIDIVRLAEEHPADVVLTLLCCAPTCDREMRHYWSSLCSHVAYHLALRLSKEQPSWDLPLLAFLVEVLECLDVTKCCDIVLRVMSWYLKNECRQRRRLALRGLVVLSKDPSMARPMRSLSRSFLDLLGDADGDIVGMSLSVFMNIFQKKRLIISSTSALKLANPGKLLASDNSLVQLLSIQLFEKVMDLVVDQGKKPLKRIVGQSLLLLFLHCHEENQRVAKASLDTLLQATRFLNKRSLKQAVKNENLMKFGKCLLAEDRSRAAEHLRRALPYLEHPQEPLREAATRFIALEAMNKDDSPSSTNLEIQAIFGQRCAELRSSAGFGEPVSQEQEPVKRTSQHSVTPYTADAEHR
ncbi:hypothetical protein HGM15179_008296 [Zosterops borbonicus]|uniref:Uncharacterized protein n=1 Tax=Zosterops borbonicus TaxID=364589 RepID=A0A8K1GIR9_9PASS|nr:hypothetical protein HGM15179_008296 [Zosterops borbonicus]